MDQAYIAIGKAVVAVQMFETVMVSCFEIFKIHSEPGYLESTKGVISPGAWKLPIRNVVKLLSERGSIAADFENRLNAFIEDRHVLIHRWFQKNGWPTDNAAEGFAPVINLATRVEAEGRALTRLLAGYMVKYADPEWAASNMDEYRARMAEIFNRSHIDSN